jgi:hypothetical protein
MVRHPPWRVPDGAARLRRILVYRVRPRIDSMTIRRLTVVWFVEHRPRVAAVTDSGNFAGRGRRWLTIMPVTRTGVGEAVRATVTVKRNRRGGVSRFSFPHR